MTPAEKLAHQLYELSMNMWWAWNPSVIKLFRDIDSEAFRAAKHNPLMVVRRLTRDRLHELAADAAMRARVDRAYREFRAYVSPTTPTWAETHAAPLRVRPVAYLSAEFGIHESLPIYSGGLGVLAGDHLKTASDLGLALVAVGLYYRESYFRQHIDPEGQQHAEYVSAPTDDLCTTLRTGVDGKPLIIEVPLAHETLLAQVWQVNVGRNQLLLLDTDVDGNSDDNRRLAARLYFGDQRVRIRQELLLGVGGIRALRACGIDWSGLHLNEGHSAFATLEYARLRMIETGGSFEDAAQEVAQSTVFTTHTPVAAGHDRFPPELVAEYLEPLRMSLRLSREQFLALGRVDPNDPREMLCMTVLAFKMSRYANAVSCLHGRVTRRAWQKLWPHHREDEVPVGHITNGVHARTWLAPAMHELYSRRIGPDWADNLTDPKMWARIEGVLDAELWETHRTLRANLVSFVRREVAAQRRRNGHSEEMVVAAATALDPDALTIGFARRFATYKRANLLFADIERLKRIVCNAERPVQIVFAGKAHPADQPGQEVLKAVVQASMLPELRSRIVFVEDYDINVARHLVAGADVWLNTPRRPMEASGTSGMKIAIHGGLHLSTMDGWWREAYDGHNGWKIGEDTTASTEQMQDDIDGASLRAVLEQEIIPLYYDRGRDGIPHRWLKKIRHAMATLIPVYNTERMVAEYAEKYYSQGR